MNFVLLVGPGKSGGPEAIHQLADTLSKLGYNASIHYVWEDCGSLRPVPEAKNEYPQYEAISVVQNYRQKRDVILVIPEVWAHLALDLARDHIVLVWWLSVDNGLLSLGRIGCYLDQYRSHPAILNSYQSAYAHAFLQSLGLDRYQLSLSDFTVHPSPAHDFRCGAPGRSITICFNPAKGAWLASLFKTQHPGVHLIPIVGMSEDEVRRALADADAYVDFGQLPGKDRMPREALLAGTRVFIRQDGAGAYKTDWLLPETAYFKTADCVSGNLIKVIQSELTSTTAHWQQARQKVCREREVFVTECMHVADTCSQLSNQLRDRSLLLDQINGLQRYPDPIARSERIQSKLVSLQNSTSWKILAPLRRVTARIGGVDPSLLD